LPEDIVHPGMSAKSVDLTETGATIVFDDGSRRDFDVVIGADGIHSAVRAALWGKDDPKFTGIVSYRAVFPRDKAPDTPDTDAFTKWWGDTPDKQIVTFPLTLGQEIFVFATTPQGDWTEEGWTLPGDVEELRAEYRDFHPDARALLDACGEVTKSALHVREPMPQWSRGHATIMGDAAHPMVPFMAQGACMAIEDAVVLARALEDAGPEDVVAALQRYEDARKPRTAQVQKNSLANDWLKKGGNADWVYGYDAWSVALA
jgi:salicylate hydroxylase